MVTIISPLASFCMLTDAPCPPPPPLPHTHTQQCLQAWVLTPQQGYLYLT